MSFAQNFIWKFGLEKKKEEKKTFPSLSFRPLAQNPPARPLPSSWAEAQLADFPLPLSLTC